jgi:hypothetical protein
MSFYYKYKKYKYLYTLKKGGSRLKQAKEKLSLLLELDRQVGEKQLKPGDHRVMEDNQQYLDFFRRFIWNSHNSILSKFAKTILDLDNLDKDLIEEIIYYVSDGQNMNAQKNRLLEELKINKGKVYLDLLVLIENKIMGSIREQNAIELENEMIQNQRDQQEWEDSEDEDQYQALQTLSPWEYETDE